MTNNRIIDPSYVNARCDHVFTGNADDDNTSRSSPPIAKYPDGRGTSPDPYNAYARPPGRSFNNTVRHPDVDVGRTHADNVNRFVRSKLAASGTDTESFVPSNDNAPPKRPDTERVAPDTTPLFPAPEPSTTAVPDTSSNPNAATKPAGRAGSTVIDLDVVAVLPALSVTVSVRVRVPGWANVSDDCAPAVV